MFVMLSLVFCCFIFTSCSVNAPEPEFTTVPQTNDPTAAPQSTVSPADAMRMVQRTRDFILVGQTDRPEASQYHWTEEFLNLLDMESLYRSYVAAGAKADDVEGFAEYLTENSPVPDNWKDIFEAGFAEVYDLKIVRYEPIKDTYYKVYVELNGEKVPYAIVNSRTGYYHG
jgi:hypothetical protein